MLELEEFKRDNASMDLPSSQEKLASPSVVKGNEKAITGILTPGTTQGECENSVSEDDEPHSEYHDLRRLGQSRGRRRGGAAGLSSPNSEWVRGFHP